MINQAAKPSCFYHPTTVLFLDDNQVFLDALELEFGARVKMKTFTDPAQAMEAINASNQEITQSVLKAVGMGNADTASDARVGFELSNMLKLIYDKSRFDNIAVLVVDYEMPGINGVEFCQKLGDKNIFKILLTAEADKDTAINAFNSGAIDKFLLKTSANLYQELGDAIAELQCRYFKELSRSIADGLGDSFKTLLDNESYKEIFHQVVTSEKATEYYLVDGSGSFLFLNKQAEPIWLMVRHANEIDDQIELLEGYESSESIVTPIKQKEKILFLLSEAEYKKPVTEWVEHMFNAEQFEVNYYYSIVKSAVTDSIDWARVVSV